MWRCEIVQGKKQGKRGRKHTTYDISNGTSTMCEDMKWRDLLTQRETSLRFGTFQL